MKCALAKSQSFFYIFVYFAFVEGLNVSMKRMFVKRKIVATSFRTLQPMSKQQCLATCFQEDRNDNCSIAGYNSDTQTCQLSLDTPQDIFDQDNDAVGVFFVKGKGYLCFGKTVIKDVHVYKKYRDRTCACNALLKF